MHQSALISQGRQLANSGKGARGGMSRLRKMGACEGCSGGMVLTQGSGGGMNKKAE